jgi:hypothetical protein
MSILIDSTMKVGFTGSRAGMSDEQYNTVKNLLMAGQPKELHLGDCFGADASAFEIGVRADLRLIGHPPDVPGGRKFCTYDEERPKKPFLVRNHDIVDETHILIACPKETKEIMRSGTWATVRYAEKVGKTVLLIYPSGRIFKCSPGFGRRS